MFDFVRKYWVVSAFAAFLLASSGGVFFFVSDGCHGKSHFFSQNSSSRSLAGSVDSNEPLVFRTYHEDFVLGLYGLTKLLTDDDLLLLQQTTQSYLNDRLNSASVELLVSIVKALSQQMMMSKEAIPLVSVNLRMMGQAVSRNVREVATLSFQDTVLAIFSERPGEYTRALKKQSDSFHEFLLPSISPLETANVRADSSNENLVVVVSASIGATIVTALVLCVCACRRKQNSAAVDDKLGKYETDNLGIASTWSSSDESSKASPTTPPRMKLPFPLLQRKSLSPCIEVDLEDGRADSSDTSSSDGGMHSLSNWTYSSSSNSSENSGSCDAESVKISLSMQSIDEFEASIRSTPPRKRHMLFEV